MKVSMFSKTGAFTKHFVVLALTAITALGFVFALNLSFKVQAAEGTGLGGTNFSTDYDSQKEVYDAANEFNVRLVEEGIVLLKNEDNALPLASGSRINVLGKNSADVAIGGTGSSTGSGSVEAEKAMSLYESLEKVGFVLNPHLVAFYENNSLSGNGRTSPAMGSNLTGLATGETPQSSYSTELLASYANYTDASLVVITRIGGEGYDLPTTMVNSSGQPIPGSAEGDHYLELDLYEKAILESLENDESVDTVIVIINASQQMELGFLFDEDSYSKIKAAIWIGGPGQSGVEAVGNVLSGQANPSGRLAATFAADFKLDPVWYNFATSGGKGLYGTINNEGVFTQNNTRFVDYEEGIYLGYRYWETAGFDADDDWAWYDENVVFPLGYGLSYTSFEWELVSQSLPVGEWDVNSQATITVRVTNTGDVAGKDVVQLYYTAPYYDGGIEKSHVRLVDFAKTPLLQPEESVELTLVAKAKDMASYDFADDNNNGFKGWELEAGDYVLRVLQNANARSTNGVANIEFTVPEADGNDAVNGATGVKFTHDEKTGTLIRNLFDDVSQRALNGRLEDKDTDAVKDSGGYMNVMTRASDKGGLAGTIPTDYPTIESRTVSQVFMNSLGVPGNVAARNAADVDKPWYQTVFPNQAANTSGTVTVFLKDLIGKDYNDPLWDTFMDQMTYQEMAQLIGDGAFHTRAIDRLGKPWSIEVDGPVGLVPRQVNGPLMHINDYVSCVYATQPVVAATWNKELVYQYGEMTGEESIWGNTEFAYSGIYAPGINIHRSQFSGRNFEYYSEDGVLSAIMAAEFTAGAYSKGLYVMMKHYVLNDQETNRSGIHTWADEQTMREIYLLPYEKAIKDGNAMGAMAAYNNIGRTWTGASYALMTELTRLEWGFEGMIITDWGGYNTTTEWMIRTGVDLLLAGSGVGVLLHEGEALTATQAWSLRRASKAIMFTVANSNAMVPRLSYGGANLNQPDFLRGTPYQFDASGARANYQLDEALDITYSAVGLPSQLTLDPSTGIITGTMPPASTNWWESAPPTSYTFTVTATIPEGTTINTVVSQQFTIRQAALTVVPSLDSGRVGQSYYSDALRVDPTLPVDQSNITFRLDPGAGIPGWFVIRPASQPLPAGLVLNPDGTITGTPTQAVVDREIIVQVMSPGFADTFITRKITILPAIPVITFNNSLLDGAKLGSAYNAALVATGAEGIEFSSNDLPAGLELAADGTITGTPLEVGTYVFSVTASAEGFSPVSASVVINVSEADLLPQIELGNIMISNAKVGKAINATLTATGASGITYSAIGLPAGLTLNANGSLSGAPTVSGTFFVRVTASAPGAISTEAALVIVVAPEEEVIVELPEIVFNDIMLSAGKVGVAFNASLVASGAEGITFAATNLPAGLTLNANGSISGTPTAAGTYLVKVTASADDAIAAEAAVVIVVAPADPVVLPVISFTDVLLSAGEVGEAFSASLTASGATGITFAATGLPAGLTLNADGTISGTPTAAGTFLVTVTASASGAQSASASVVFAIAAAAEEAPETGCGSSLNLTSIGMILLTISLAGVFFIYRKRH